MTLTNLSTGEIVAKRDDPLHLYKIIQPYYGLLNHTWLVVNVYGDEIPLSWDNIIKANDRREEYERLRLINQVLE